MSNVLKVLIAQNRVLPRTTRSFEMLDTSESKSKCYYPSEMNIAVFLCENRYKISDYIVIFYIVCHPKPPDFIFSTCGAPPECNFNFIKTHKFPHRAERGGPRGRAKLASLAVYNEDETNDLSDLGIGTSSASGKSSLSGDYDNNSVMVSSNQRSTLP